MKDTLERKIRKRNRTRKLVDAIRLEGDCGRRLYETTKKWEQKATLAKQIFARKLKGQDLKVATKLAETKGYIVKEIDEENITKPPKYDTILVSVDTESIIGSVFA